MSEAAHAPLCKAPDYTCTCGLCDTKGPHGWCSRLKCAREAMDGERWVCDYCGRSFWLDYEEIR